MASPISISAGKVDVKGIVSQLMKVERQPIDKLNAKNTAQQAKISAFGLIKSNVSSFQSAVRAIGTSNPAIPGVLGTISATSSDTSTLTATASSTAAAGTYAVIVNSLAQSQSITANGVANSKTAISDGTATTVTFDFGTISGGTLANGVYTSAAFNSNGSGTKSITIDGTNNTLEGIRDTINNAKMGVTASIVNDGSATPYRLVIASNSTGETQSLKITTSGGDGTVNNLLGYDPAGTQNMKQSIAAQNANLTVNGVAISKPTNNITDAIEGVSFTVNKVNTSATNITVARDSANISDKVATFVKAYNDLYSALKNSSAYKSKSALEGDATLRSFMGEMRDIAVTQASSGTLTRLSDIGITFNASGAMQFDSGKFSNVLNNNFADVENIFKEASNGVMSKFDNWAKTILDPGGKIDSKTSNINNSINATNKQISSLELRMKNAEQRYLRTYSELNTMLESMSKTSSYLAQQLG